MSDHYCCKRCGQRYDECDCSTRLTVQKPVYDLTDWFPGTTNPFYTGWYQVKIRYDSDTTGMRYYHNGWWFWNDIDMYKGCDCPWEWRGILK